MIPQNHHTDVQQALSEAQALLAQHGWDVRDPIFLEGEHVCILFDPYPAAEAGHFNVPVTILLLQSRADAVVQTPLVLATSARAFYYGRLSLHGQALFRSLPAGIYNVELVLDATHFQQAFTQLPEQARQSLQASSVPLRLIIPGPTGDGDTFRTADGSLVVAVRATEAGDLLVSLESTDPTWDGRLTAIAWRPTLSAEGALNPWQLLLAVLSRDEQSHTCAATVNLGQVSFPCDLLLPEHPLPDEILSTELVAVVEASLAQALPAPALHAWRQPFERTPALPAKIRQLVEDALHRGAEAGRLWRLEAANLYRLASTIAIQLGTAAASFGHLSASLKPQLVPVAALRAGNTAAAGFIELLEIPHPEANLVLKLSLGPTSNGLGTLVVSVAAAIPPGPIHQAKVTLRDTDGTLLESAPTDEDGLALFQALEAGAYQIHVHHHDTTWQIPVTFETSRDT